MTYGGDVYFVSVPVSVFRHYTCWHAISLRSEIKDGETTGSDKLEG
ncbi:hypothetical protein SLEP1_g17310 [Rubroshorea leprosula]|uniref:Uncharacterized protein n=1 Tax=Rubroshorea leprosula TaxID=152421 RepID=A0AAV5J2Q0_9ROSI|nr:hypothetical protein SLEP1_g17310 [Rubroshorea leprosula]